MADETKKSFDPTAMLMGWLAGIWIAGQRGKRKPEPVAYLYNGVRLPKLPESELPYVSIVGHEQVYACYFMSAPEYSKNDGKIYLAKGTSVSEYRANDGEWQHKDSWVLNYEDATSAELYVWASYDILNADGTVYLQGTAPIPVYE